MANSTIEMKKRLRETRRTLVRSHGVVDKQRDGASGSKIIIPKLSIPGSI